MKGAFAAWHNVLQYLASRIPEFLQRWVREMVMEVCHLDHLWKADQDPYNEGLLLWLKEILTTRHYFSDSPDTYFLEGVVRQCFSAPSKW
jgi:hypothetical protein